MKKQVLLKIHLLVILLFLVLPFVASALDILGIPLPEGSKEISNTPIGGKVFARFEVPLSLEETKKFYDSEELAGWEVKSEWLSNRKSFVQRGDRKLPKGFSVVLTGESSAATTAVFSISK